MSAPDVNSDHELAYRLQLQEAMAASLAFQPSSSTSSSQSPQPPPPALIDDGVNFSDRQTLEFDKRDTDRMIIETETKKLQPDQKLAPESLQMPEEQWQVDGDDFKRPIGEASSSKSEDHPEMFRVYFKGLLSQETLYGPSSSNKKVTMGGIGVAICDSMDKMIFEMRKPLDLIKGDQMSRQIVEVQALIEALKAATAMDLKRIVFYCDYHPLYQFVSGRWRPKQQKIINFLDQVNLLRKSFTYCEPSLIASKDVKFAFKLAREAINSQISKVVSSQEKLENCVICLDDKSIDQFFSVEGCAHRYCYSCMKQHIEVKLLHGVLPKCPHEGCRNELRIGNCKKFLTPKFTEMMTQLLKENSIPVTEKVYCPYPKCSTLMSRTELFRLPRLVNGFGARTCFSCRGNFCINCRVPWHENMNCEEYKRRNPTSLVEESKLKNLAAKNLWRQCIKCKHMIELAAGCYHITCRCGYEFCYTCGAEWKNKKATCNCPLWVEANILDAEEDDDFEVEHNVHNVFEDGEVVFGGFEIDDEYDAFGDEDDVPGIEYDDVFDDEDVVPEIEYDDVFDDEDVVPEIEYDDVFDDEDVVPEIEYGDVFGDDDDVPEIEYDDVFGDEDVDPVDDFDNLW